MLASQFSLTSAQLSRNTFAEVVESKTPWREAALEGFRRRNTFLDALFYDIGVVPVGEAARISPWLAAEGTILIVPPSETEPLRLCRNVDEFAANGGSGVRVLAVAGVGSSALGSAAFARNIADAFGEPVAALVSGYGLADLISEALGGWFWFGSLNYACHQFEHLDERARAPMSNGGGATAATVSATNRLSLDTRTVCSLLTDKRFTFSLLAGHSKGNLVISEALFGLEHSRHRPADDTWLVTVSAVITMPQRFKHIIDVIGGIDRSGALNSRRGLGVEERPALAWHHTNTELPFHLPVTRVFRELIAKHNIN